MEWSSSSLPSRHTVSEASLPMGAVATASDRSRGSAIFLPAKASTISPCLTPNCGFGSFMIGEDGNRGLEFGHLAFLSDIPEHEADVGERDFGAYAGLCQESAAVVRGQPSAGG